MKTLLKNKKAYRNYEIVKTYTAGIKLMGEEVKALREGRGNLTGSYVRESEGNLYLVGFNLPKYSKSSNSNYDPKRNRKLLLKKREISDISAGLNNKGRTVVPLEVLLKDNLVKLKIALAKGRDKPGKKQYEKEKQLERQAKREVKEMGF